MEIGLKERLIGAAVLVILAVIIIPWVLKGGSPDTTVTKSLTLPAATATHAQPAYHMDLNNPQAATNGVQPPSTSTHAEPAAVAPPAPAVLPTILPPPKHEVKAGITGGWVVQAGSYGNEANARSVQDKLVKHGYRAFVSRFQQHGHTFYRVRVGPYEDRASAEHLVSEIGRASGGKAVVVPNN